MPDLAAAIAIEVSRYRPEREDKPVWQRYDVPFTPDMSVLQGLQHIKDELDGTLSFRWSCRMAICGSCGMMIDGKPRLACQTFLRDLLPGPVRIEALAHFPIERDLIVSVDAFVAKLEAVKPYLIPKQPRRLDEGEHLQTPAQMARFEPYSACINCMLCYSACPQFGLDPGFTGPGVLALLHRYNVDSRDGGRAERMPMLNAEEGVWSCTAVGYCSEVCPKHVDPANAVNQNKLNSAKDYFLRFLARRAAGSQANEAPLPSFLGPKGHEGAPSWPLGQARRSPATGALMSRGAQARRGYVRPMQGWWRRDPFFVRYMAREATALAVAAYAVVLAVAVVCLARGEAAWNGWLTALQSPAAITLHAVLLAAFVYHAYSWFGIMPKTMPMLFVGGRRVAAATITRAGWAAALVTAIVLFALAGGWPP